MDKHSENINKELEDIKKDHSEVRNIITKMTSTLKGISGRLIMQKNGSESGRESV